MTKGTLSIGSVINWINYMAKKCKIHFPLTLVTPATYVTPAPHFMQNFNLYGENLQYHLPFSKYIYLKTDFLNFHILKVLKFEI